MRIRVVTSLVVLVNLLGIVPANAMGYVLWSAEGGRTSTYTQEISVISGNTFTAWKAQVRISPEMLFGIAFVQRSEGVFEAEFGTYFNQGVEPIPTTGSTCSYNGANSNQQNFSNCKISINISLPARVKLSIKPDKSDTTGKIWLGYFTDMNKGDEKLIAKFNVGIANLAIQDIYHYTYPYGINECSVVPQIQESIWWRPTSENGKYNFSSTNKSDCGNLSWVVPQSYVNADGVVIKLNTPKTETVLYSGSLLEKLYPDVWASAYEAGKRASQEEHDKKYLILEASSAAAKIDLQNQLIGINDQIKKINLQIKKICGAKKKPAGC